MSQIIDWRPINSAPHNRFVLVLCHSGYSTFPWQLFIARHEPDSHRDGWWSTVSGDRVRRHGPDPEWWAELPVLLLPQKLQRTQSQAALNDQLLKLSTEADRMGLNDAADFLRRDVLKLK